MRITHWTLACMAALLWPALLWGQSPTVKGKAASARHHRQSRTVAHIHDHGCGCEAHHEPAGCAADCGDCGACDVCCQPLLPRLVSGLGNMLDRLFPCHRGCCGPCEPSCASNLWTPYGWPDCGCGAPPHHTPACGCEDAPLMSPELSPELGNPFLDETLRPPEPPQDVRAGDPWRKPLASRYNPRSYSASRATRMRRASSRSQTATASAASSARRKTSPDSGVVGSALAGAVARPANARQPASGVVSTQSVLSTADRSSSALRRSALSQPTGVGPSRTKGPQLLEGGGEAEALQLAPAAGAKAQPTTQDKRDDQPLKDSASARSVRQTGAQRALTTDEGFLIPLNPLRK